MNTHESLQLARCTPWQCKWQKNAIGLHCRNSHSRVILMDFMLISFYNSSQVKIIKIHMQIPPTGYVGLILRSPAVATPVPVSLRVL